MQYASIISYTRVFVKSESLNFIDNRGFLPYNIRYRNTRPKKGEYGKKKEYN